MSQALHIFRKDLRRGWPLLALWAALLLGWLALSWADPLEADELVQPINLSLLVVLAGLVAVSLIVHEEPLVGARAFWMSRPIRPAALFAAKAAFVFVFLALPPALCQLAVLLRFKAPLEQVGAGLFEVTLVWMALLSAGFAVATLTPSTPAYVLTLLGVWVAFAFVMEVVRALVPTSPASVEDLFWRTLAGGAAAVPLGMAVALHQYRTRRTRRSMALGALAIVAAGAVPLLISGAAIQRAIEGEASIEPLRVELTPGPGAERFSARDAGSYSRGHVELWAIANPLGLPAGSELELVDLRGRIEWDNRAPTPFTSPSSWFSRRGIRVAAGGRQWLGGRGPLRFGQPLELSGSRELGAFLGLRGRVSARNSARLWTLDAAGRAPLAAGGRAAGPGWAVVVEDVHRDDERLRVEIRRRRVRTSIWPAESPEAVLVNVARGQMIASRAQRWRDGFDLGRLFGGPRVRVDVAFAEFPLVFRSFDAQPSLVGDDWLSGAELLFLDYEPSGRVWAQIEIPDLRLEPSRRPGPRWSRT